MLENKELIYKFFYHFSRFEFALKTTGYILSNDNNVLPDWDRFAKSIDQKYELIEIKSEEFQKSIKYFFEQPPKKQIINSSGTLDWEEYKPKKVQHSFKELLMLVRRVRNSFFHGGKFISGSIIGSERDTTLIEYGLIILKNCLELNQEVKDKFQADGVFLE